MSVLEIMEQIRKLPANEQRELVEQIEREFAGVSDELSPEQMAELDRRAQAALKHPGRGTAIEEISDEISRRLSSPK